MRFPDPGHAMVVCGDCADVLQTIPEQSVHAIVTDPPYGLSNVTPDQVTAAVVAWASGDRTRVPDGSGFMSHRWDRFVPPPAVWDECCRVLRPGGHMAVFAGPRMVDIMGLSLRMAGFEIRDSVAWLYGQGFPRGTDAKRVTGDDRWSGWHTALKPAFEPILLARKPLSGTVAGTVAEYGTGAVNVAATAGEGGRFTANVVLDESQAAVADDQSGECGAQAPVKGTEPSSPHAMVYRPMKRRAALNSFYGDTGGASRFFYCAKASASERVAWTRDDGTTVRHPTVKPLALMEWLVRLTCVPGGVVVDPFAGSGTTLAAAAAYGCAAVGVEQSPEYVRLAVQRPGVVMS